MSFDRLKVILSAGRDQAALDFVRTVCATQGWTLEEGDPASWQRAADQDADLAIVSLPESPQELLAAVRQVQEGRKAGLGPAIVFLASREAVALAGDEISAAGADVVFRPIDAGELAFRLERVAATLGSPGEKAERASVAATAKREAVLRKRFEALDRASLAIQHELARRPDARAEGLHQTIVNEARSMVGAEFGALGIGTDPAAPFSPWVFSGMGLEAFSVVGRAPRPVGILGAPVKSGRTVRVKDLRQFEAFSKFPRGHVEMTSYLGVPMVVGGKVVGTLYLTNKSGAEEFSEEDQKLIEMLAERAGLAIEVQRLTAEVRQAVVAREELLALVSHDLKNPLATAQLSARILAKHPEEGERRQGRRQVEVILSSVERMSRLVEDLLDAATIEAGSFVVESAECEAAQILEEARAAMQPLAEDRSVSVFCAGGGTVECDRARVVQVLGNLVGNALKFVSEGAQVLLSAERRGNEIVFSVADQGPGIGKEDLPYLFDRYWKGSGSRRGSGLGLYICKGIVSAHGGRIWVESEPGNGTTVRFALRAV